MDLSTPKSLYERIGGAEGIDRLLKDFYGRVKTDPILGPVFASRIDDWDIHLHKIHVFWSYQTGGPDLYPGGMGRHIGLPISTEHFDRWVEEWAISCSKLLPEAEAVDMVAIALRFRKFLEQMIAQNRRV